MPFAIEAAAATPSPVGVGASVEPGLCASTSVAWPFASSAEAAGSGAGRASSSGSNGLRPAGSGIALRCAITSSQAQSNGNQCDALPIHVAPVASHEQMQMQEPHSRARVSLVCDTHCRHGC